MSVAEVEIHVNEWNLGLLSPEEAGQCVSTNSALQERLGSVDYRHGAGFHQATLYAIYPKFCTCELVLLKCPHSADSKLFSS